MRKWHLPNVSNYRPLCYSGSGTPILLLNQEWAQSFTCMVFLNLAMALMIIMLHRVVKADSLFNTIYILITIWNISYLLTQFINPGVVVSEDQPHSSMVERCSDCDAILHENQRHCDICRVCIRGQDHHCGWFGRCIGIYNIIPFYIFMLTGCTLIFCFGATAISGIQ